MPIITIQHCTNCSSKTRDVPHEWIFRSPTLKELREIKALTGLRGNDFLEATDDGDPDALAALLYVLHKRDKITIPFEDIDLDFEALDIRPTEEEKAEAEKAAEQAKGKKP